MNILIVILLFSSAAQCLVTQCVIKDVITQKSLYSALSSTYYKNIKTTTKQKAKLEGTLNWTGSLEYRNIKIFFFDTLILKTIF